MSRSGEQYGLRLKLRVLSDRAMGIVVIRRLDAVGPLITEQRAEGTRPPSTRSMRTSQQ
ncbi:MAG TPA: hypothetical protein VFO16_04935 [Pseudonocardiaceae bacterium]|nr:hypothetical protein [Pseudonocardiaceae bacterium]